MIARGLGLDVRSVHEVGRQGYSDREQLQFAVSEERVLVTRNRDDFIKLTIMFFQTGEVHHGILIIPYSMPNKHPGRIAHALKSWHARYPEQESPGLGFIDFL